MPGIEAEKLEKNQQEHNKECLPWSQEVNSSEMCQQEKNKKEKSRGKCRQWTFSRGPSAAGGLFRWVIGHATPSGPRSASGKALCSRTSLMRPACSSPFLINSHF